jgi:hypothetical protein
MKMKLIVILPLLFIYVKNVESASLEAVTDDELVNSFKSEKYVVVLFSE